MKNDFEIRGKEAVIKIRRPGGPDLEALIDLEDLQKVQNFPGRWTAQFNRTTGKFRVFGIQYVDGFPRRALTSLQRLLTGLPKGCGVGSGLDNRQETLRRTIPAYQRVKE